MNGGNVLYDIPGPKARRRALIGSVIGLVLLLGVFYVVYLRLEENGQFEWEKWAPYLDPNDERFSDVWRIMRQALWATLKAAVLAVIFSLVIGTAFALARITSKIWYRWILLVLLEVFRGVPVVIAIFFAARVLPELGVDLETMWYLVIGLTAYNSVLIAEIVRSGIDALPRGQSEAAYALGFTRWQTLMTIQLPQAFRLMLPALISQLVVILKDTSLGFIISYPELVRSGGILVQNLRNPIQTYLIIGIIFIVVNYLLSRLAITVERRLSRSATVQAKPVEAAAVDVT